MTRELKNKNISFRLQLHLKIFHSNRIKKETVQTLGIEWLGSDPWRPIACFEIHLCSANQQAIVSPLLFHICNFWMFYAKYHR